MTIHHDWRQKLDRALAARSGLLATQDAVRLIHDRADGFDGLVVERFGATLIAQLFEGRWTASENSAREIVAEIAARVGATSVYRKRFPRDRSAALARLEAEHNDAQPWLGAPAPPAILIRENGLRLEIHPYDGYSTGLFLEHRASRAMVRGLAAGATVLNTFAYTCGFSVAAAAGGAARVVSIDVSRKYLEWGRRNFDHNQLTTDGHAFIPEDVLVYMGRAARRGDRFDIIILDPPTFGRAKSSRRAFSLRDDLPRLVELAAGLLAPRGSILLATNHRGATDRQLDQLLRKAFRDRLVTIEPQPLPEDFGGDPAYAKSLLARAGEP